MRIFSLQARVFVCLLTSVAMLLSVCLAARADDAIPVTTVLGGVTNIDDLGYYGIAYRYTDGRTGQKPMGWTGHFDEQTGISSTTMGTQDGKRAYLLHPIWHDGTGDTDQTFRLALPKATAITLAFSLAMKLDVVGKSDGVTFRVFVNGEKLMDQNKADGAWTDFKFDLTKFAGQTITLVFEANPGPKNDPSWDYGLWGDRRLVCAGVPAKSIERAFVAQPAPLDGKPEGWGGASPTHLSALDTAKIRSVASPATTDILGGLVFHLTSGQRQITLPFATGAGLDLVAPDGKIVTSNSSAVHCTVTQSTPEPGERSLSRPISIDMTDPVFALRFIRAIRISHPSISAVSDRLLTIAAFLCHSITKRSVTPPSWDYFRISSSTTAFHMPVDSTTSLRTTVR